MNFKLGFLKFLQGFNAKYLITYVLIFIMKFIFSIKYNVDFEEVTTYPIIDIIFGSRILWILIAIQMVYTLNLIVNIKNKE